jgi:hypothetical protein|tara:strand:+ start:273 stop:884 length:612 start_codon:yes stop_codon:yes gene_type:complete
MKSLSEIETTSKRASRAAGFSWGVSEEIAKGIRLLELFGLPGIKNLNEYFKLKNKKDLRNLSIIKKKNKFNKYSLCPINLGIGILDQIKTLEKLKKITFDKIAYPILLLPFLSRSSDVIGKKILCKFEKNTFLLNFNVNILSNLSVKKYPLLAKKTEITFLENKDNFTEKEWKSLYKLSENTFVEETESLKQGAAGAGLTDND